MNEIHKRVRARIKKGEKVSDVARALDLNLDKIFECLLIENYKSHRKFIIIKKYRVIW